MAVISFCVKKASLIWRTFLIHNESDDPNYGVVLETDAQSNLTPLTYVHSSAILSDGRVVVVGYDGNGPIVVNCYLVGTTTLDWTYSIVGSSYGYYADVGVLSNGNIVVSWGDYDDDDPYFFILSSSGVLVKDITNADTTGTQGADYSYPTTVTPLADGGFFIMWSNYSSSNAGSSWNADGSNNWPYDSLEGGDEDSKPIQMPDGGGANGGWMLCPALADGYVNLYNPDDLTDDAEYIDIGITTPQTNLHMAKASSWTDRVAIVWGQGGNTVASILDNDGDLQGGYGGYYKKEIISGISPIDFIALPDNTFLLQFTDGATEYGQSYYILDSDLNVVSGPHGAFTGMTGHSGDIVRGCAGII